MFKTKTLQRIMALVTGMLLFSAVSGSVTAEVPSGIIKPAEGAMLSGTVGIYGVVDDPSFSAYQLDLLPLSDQKTSYFLERGTARIQVPGRLGRIQTSLYQDGDYRLRLRVIKRDGNFSDYFTSITIANGPRLQNGIVEPLPGARLTCLATVSGVARSDDFRKRQVDLLLGGAEDKAVFLGRGSQPRASSETLVQFDTTPFPNGDHVLRLRVVRRDGNYDSFFTRVTIDNSIMASPLNQKTCSCAVPNPMATPAGPNGITNPPNGAIIRGVIPICGIAGDPNFSAWEMDLLFGGDETKASLVAFGETANPSRNPFTLLDTTGLPDGKYGLRLRVSRADDVFSQYMISVCVQNHASPSSGQACN